MSKSARKREAGATRPWVGGIIRTDSNGIDTYWIYKRLNGKRWKISLKVHTLEAALERYALFERDPAGFKVEGVELGSLKFTRALVDEFLAHSRLKRNTERWVEEQDWILEWWLGHLRDRDLKKLSLGRDLVPISEGPSRRNHVRVMKSFYGWLRKVKHAITAVEDPTFGNWSVLPQRAKGLSKLRAFTIDDYRAVAKHLKGIWAAAARVQAATGWHYTEAERFAEGGTIIRVDGAPVLVCPLAKDSDEHRTEVVEGVVEAANVLLKAGALNYDGYNSALQRACKKAGLPPGAVTPGSFRHSVATWAVGVHKQSMKDTSTFLGHRSEATTRKYYALFATPKRVKTIDD